MERREGEVSGIRSEILSIVGDDAHKEETQMYCDLSNNNNNVLIENNHNKESSQSDIMLVEVTANEEDIKVDQVCDNYVPVNAPHYYFSVDLADGIPKKFDCDSRSVECKVVHKKTNEEQLFFPLKSTTLIEVVVVPEEEDTMDDQVRETVVSVAVADIVSTAETVVHNACDDDTHEVSSRECKNRKRVATPKDWNRNQAKILRMQGETYLGCRRKNPKDANIILRDVVKESRKMGLPCTSTLCAKWKTRLCNTILEEERKLLFQEFWQKMDWTQKRAFVCSSVEIKATGRKTTKKLESRRSTTLLYFLKINGEKVPVCREMFLSTLGLKRAMVKNWLQNFHGTKTSNAAAADPANISDGDDTGGEEEDEMSIVANSFEKDTTNEQIHENSEPSTSGRVIVREKSDRKTFLRQFFEKLPKLPSHYCRKNSKTMYLQSDISNWTQLYELYLADCAENHQKPSSRYTFDVVRRQGEVAIYKPKKDRCDLCYNFENKISSGTSEEYLQHRQKKEEAQREKENDKASAKEGDCHTLCCDLMAVQSVPHIRASSAYFKLKLAIHNFTIYDLNSHDVMNFWFDETESCLSASTFASFVVDYVTKLLEESSRTVIIYSDGCGYQNRNAVLANALLHLSVEKEVTIIQKYLVKGHTYMECDSVHSHVENAFKNRDVYLPHHYVQFSSNARKNPGPYRSTLVDHSFFKDFGRQEMMAYQSIRPGKRAGDPTVNDIRMLQYDPAGKIFFKIDFSDDLKELPCRPKPIFRSIASFPPLLESRPRIPKDKYDDLQWLKRMLPIDTHSFYASIPCEDESRREARQQHKIKKNKKDQTNKKKRLQ